VPGKEALQPEIKGKYRAGDIRHCFADITRATSVLGFQPPVTLENGIEDLAQWLDGQVAIDREAEARAELLSYTPLCGRIKNGTQGASCF
jgi:dTDP-L-rhamnose 4-epimerase